MSFPVRLEPERALRIRAALPPDAIVPDALLGRVLGYSHTPGRGTTVIYDQATADLVADLPRSVVLAPAAAEMVLGGGRARDWTRLFENEREWSEALLGTARFGDGRIVGVYDWATMTALFMARRDPASLATGEDPETAAIEHLSYTIEDLGAPDGPIVLHRV